MRCFVALLAPLLLLALAGAAACGPPPPPLVPAVDIDRYCTARIACGLEATNTNPLASCVATQRRTRLPFQGFGLSFEEGRRIDCFLMQPSCMAAIDCASRSHGATYCTLHPGVSCDGNVLVDCGNPMEVTTTDCARLAMTCRNGSLPSTASCTTGRSCAGTATSCDGNVRVACVNELEWREDCNLVQPMSRCGMTPSDGAACLPANAPACTMSGFAARCEMNNVAVNCGRSGLETRVTCGAGTTCMAMGTEARCVPDTTTCSDGEADMCMGDSVQYCLDSRRVTVACSAVGTSTCGPRMGGAAGCQ